MKKIFIALLIGLVGCVQEPTADNDNGNPQSKDITLVNIGTNANDHTGDPLRTAFQKVNTAITQVNTNTADILLRLPISDTVAMLAHYAKITAVGLKVNISDTANMLVPYLKHDDIPYYDATSSIQTQLNRIDTTIHFITTGYYKNVGLTSREYYVSDVNKDGHLEELPDAIVLARSYFSSVIIVASGRYDIDEALVFDINNKFFEVRGNNTFLDLPAGYSGNAITITSTGDLSNLNISGITWQEKATHQFLWDGISITMGTGQDLQMCSFKDLTFRYCDRAINVVLTGSGWMNANNFLNIKASSPVSFLKVDRTGGNDGDYFNGNQFSNIQIQAVSGTTLYGIEDLYGYSNVFSNFIIWDSGAINGITFNVKSSNNQIINTDIGEATFTDNSTVQTNKISGKWGSLTKYRENYVKYNRLIHPITFTGNVTANVGITAAMLNDVIIYNGNSSIDISANPQVVAGIDGQEITIIATDYTNTLTLENGTGLSISGTFVMHDNDMIKLIYSEYAGVWIEVARSVK